jgi:EAL domain-containing protein (putative c-di-GMP-specific phosphodiesterase class I)
MRDLGCDQLQGFRFGRPIPASALYQAKVEPFRRSA